MPASVRQICEQRFVSALKDLSSSREMKSFELHDIVQHAKVLTIEFNSVLCGNDTTQAVVKIKA